MRTAYLFTFVALIAAFLIGGFHGFLIALLLGILEVSLSFDNAVVNATVLKNMSKKWQKRFLTWGIAIAVFGMRLIFPIIIVAIGSKNGLLDVVKMATQQPEIYKQNLISAHRAISSFGAAFLLMVFTSFLFDQEKDVHWLPFEKKFSKFDRQVGQGIVFAIIAFVGNISFVGVILGLLIYGLIKACAEYFSESAENVLHGGIAGFVYLEVLDASFSLDGVIGAFAVSSDIFIIMLGLGIGAIFIRSMTINLVRNKTLEEYIYLEHGAHYGIGALALIMLLSLNFQIPEIITGLVGVAFIVLSLISSINHKKIRG